MRRYFDEYRGLRETSGHVERIGVRSTVRDVRGLVGADRALDARAAAGRRARQAAATGRSAAAPRHAQARRPRSARRRTACRRRVQRAISLEGRASAGPPTPAPARSRRRTAPARAARHLRRRSPTLARDGAVPLAAPVPGMADGGAAAHRGRDPAVPARQRRALDDLQPAHPARGARPHGLDVAATTRSGRHASEWPAVIRAQPARVLPADLRARSTRASTSGTAPTSCSPRAGTPSTPCSGCRNCRARAYLVQDHEPEFFATSAESVFAERTYGEGLYCIAASPWLSDLDRSAATAREARSFELGVDHDVYRPRPIARRRDTVIFYARDVTPRRAVPLGVLALQELQRRRPDTALRALRRRAAGSTRRSPTRTSASRRPTSSPGPTRRRPSGSRCR